LSDSGKQVEETYEEVVGKIHGLCQFLTDYCTEKSVPILIVMYPPEVEKGIVNFYSDGSADPILHLGMLTAATAMCQGYESTLDEPDDESNDSND